MDKKVSLEKRIKEAKDRYASKKTPPISSSSGFALVADLISGVAVGAFLGYIIDQKLNTLPLFLLICIFLGTVGGFYVFYKQLSRSK